MINLLTQSRLIGKDKIVFFKSLKIKIKLEKETDIMSDEGEQVKQVKQVRTVVETFHQKFTFPSDLLKKLNSVKSDDSEEWRKLLLDISVYIYRTRKLWDFQEMKNVSLLDVFETLTSNKTLIDACRQRINQCQTESDESVSNTRNELFESFRMLNEFIN